ncbi:MULTISPECIES: DUF4150 domain-containing protein [Xenorhabdus]|uniref:Uncharacterized protein n=1 Tax=Xenorhabdus stockiae TaxID=351614 RepID=A0A2D0KU66_9GAMM|nr:MULTISPECIES: DUF4150 domain-containing protein [Xenorhabdus]MCC8365806.1 DUF4150 domain-containing protein [Xenorhabdus sp. PB61.4]MCC8378251.1 DUF4150 domain-containing protein [Xenorhabdus sp. PB30.3]PHM56584.1 hypothetical protein Xekk_01808 [Xenorhabdus sp. KK7.4]PHM66996.1 hypothetical protein Xsto_00651 [Xenorhabdus stockiae]PHM72844.1 hypothetical protein Xekj_00047 [Xenorhabdus sp. KJ12.1]
MFANTQSGGMDLATPDVCMTPPFSTPIPYPNMAQGPTGITNAMNILFAGAPAHNLMTIYPMTMGDNAGVNTGVASGTVMGPARHTLGANTLLIKGAPVTRLTSMSMQNSTNSVGCRITPSQTKVLILSA